MPWKHKILSMAISGLLLLPAGGQAVEKGPRWSCVAAPEGGWDCSGEGSRVLVEPPSDAPVGILLPTPPSPTESAPATPSGTAEQETGTAPEALPEAETLPEPEALPEPETLPEPEALSEPLGEPPVMPPSAGDATAAEEPPPLPPVSGEPETQAESAAPELPANESATQADSDSPKALPSVPASEPDMDAQPERTPVGQTDLQSPAGETEAAEPHTQESSPTFESPLTRGARTAMLYRDTDYSVCAPRPTPTPSSPAPGPGDDLIRIGSDSAEYYPSQQTARLTGDVEIRHDPQRVLADEVLYNHLTQELDARGSVFYERPGLRVESAGGMMNLDSYQGMLQDIEYRLPEQGARGQAESLEVESGDESRFRGISYTTCPPGSNAWALEAEEIQLHHAQGVGQARNARLRLGSVPVMYLPYVSFPVGDQRKSGLLAPSLGYSDTSGVDLSLPYYLNLAPNYDATITPRFLSERGPMLGAEFRYLTEHQSGQLRGEILPHDLERDQRDSATRGAFSLTQDGRLGERWTTQVDAGYVSDSRYLDDLGDSLAVTSQRQLERRADLRYHGDGWSFLGRVQGFQTVDEDILQPDRPYSRLPQALLTLDRPLPVGIPLSAQMDAEYVYFDKSDSVVGHRVDLYPALTLDLESPWAFFRPKAGVRHTLYRLDDQPRRSPDDPDRTLPIASLDTGLILENNFRIGDNALVQTLEPRLYYLYVPHRKQTGLPLFDTSERDFTFESLFEENRFNGADRLGDANQLTTALVTRSIQDVDGAERLRLGVGQILYFEDPRVQLDTGGPYRHDHSWRHPFGEGPYRVGDLRAWREARRDAYFHHRWAWHGANDLETESSSALVGGALAKLGDGWTLRGDVQWDPHLERTESSGARIEYRGEQGQVVNLSYRLRRGEAEHSDFSTRLPLARDTHVVAHWDYSWLHDRTIEAFGGIEYGRGCCWLVRAVARTWTDDLELGDSNVGFFVQLELKGLTSLGSRVDDMLEKGILGYGTDF